MSESVNPQELNPADRSLRNRLAEVIGNTSCIATDLEVADAVIAVLDLENRIVSAIRSYAGCEQMALTHHDPNGGGTEFDALTRLINEAPKIARYAMKYRRPDGIA